MNEQEIQKYKENYFKNHGRWPKSIPMTWKELTEFKSNNHVSNVLNDCTPEIMGYANQSRHKRVSLKYAILEEQATISGDSLIDTKITVKQIERDMIANLQARILSDTEVLEIEVDSDPFAKLKSIFKIKPKKKKVKVECKTLYQRLAVKFPENTHTVHFNIIES